MNPVTCHDIETQNSNANTLLLKLKREPLLLLIALCRYSLGLIGSSGEVRGDASSTGLLAMDPSRLMLSTGAALVAGGYVRGHVSLCSNMCSETL